MPPAIPFLGSPGPVILPAMPTPHRRRRMQARRSALYAIHLRCTAAKLNRTSMTARIRMDADALIRAIHSFLDAAKADLTPEDHLRVLESTVDRCDELLEAQELGNGALHNLPTAT